MSSLILQSFQASSGSLGTEYNLIPLVVTATVTDPVIPTNSTARLIYTKLGRHVNVSMFLSNPGSPAGGSDGEGTYAFQLPYTSETSMATYTGTVTYYDGANFYAGFVMLAGGTFNIYLKDAATTALVGNHTNTPMTAASTLLTASFTYSTNVAN